MNIRKAQKKDLCQLHKLLKQVNLVHHQKRPDLFKCATKYTDEELLKIIEDENTPILCAVNDKDEVKGYAFCIFKTIQNNQLMADSKTLYIDDLCVDENMRHQHIGQLLYDAAVNLARQNGCYNLTLNVWAFNESAIRFYEKCGLTPQKIGMEMIL